MIFGLAPAIQTSKPDVVPVLKNEIIPAGTTHRGLRGFLALRQVLVVTQIALSLVSLVAAAVFLRSLTRAERTDTGFETRGVLVMNFNLGREGYTPDRGQIFYEQAAERIAALPGVTRAAIAQNAPLAGGLLRSVFPEEVDTTTRDRILVQVNSVSGGYFDTIGIPLLRGRDFTRADTSGAPLVVIVNETMAERFWPNQDAIGKRFKFFGDAGFTTIIGVARNSSTTGSPRSRFRSSTSRSCRTIRRKPRCSRAPRLTRPGSPPPSAAKCGRSTRRCHSSTSGRWKIRSSTLWRRSARMSSSWPPSACWRWRSRRSASTASRATT